MYHVDASDNRIIRGTAIKLPHNVRSGMILPIAHRGSFNQSSFKDHCFNNLDAKLKNRIAPGDIIVAGRDFAKGETGEETTMALMGLRIGAVVAVSVNRIFFRNSINHGFPVVIFPQALEMIDDGDSLQIEPIESVIRNITKKTAARGKQFPDIFRAILEAGGIVNYISQESEKKKVKSSYEKYSGGHHGD